jgi:hypothetical protein
MFNVNCKFFLSSCCNRGNRCKFIHDKELINQRETEKKELANQKIAILKKELSMMVSKGIKIDILLRDVSEDMNFIIKLLNREIINPTMTKKDKLEYKKRIIIKLYKTNTKLFENITFAYWIIDNISWKMIKYFDKFHYDIDFMLNALSYHYKVRYFIHTELYEKYPTEIEIAKFKGMSKKKVG